MTSVATPTISRILPDGTLIELLYDRAADTTTLARCAPYGTITVSAEFDTAACERLTPYDPRNNLLTSGCVLLPSAVGEPASKAELLDAIKAYLHAYIDLPELFGDIAAHYVLLSWVHDAFNELGYVRFMGPPGSGKTRALLAIGSLCYKPIFASGASTVSPMFHLLDTVGGTLILDEADLRFSDSTADLTKILNNGTVKGLPVLRTMTTRNRELHPQAFKVFGPKLIAMREPFADDALETRFLTHRTGKGALRPDIPISIPDRMARDAQALRNLLLAWRFSTFHRTKADPTRLVAGISPRANQTALALLSLVDDAGLRDVIADRLAATERRAAEERAASPEATMAGVLRTVARSTPTPYIPVSAVMQEYNDLTRPRGVPPISAKAAGAMIRERFGLSTQKSRGVFVIPPHERARIDALGACFDRNQAEAKDPG